ncbi:unnamed protein product, partial [Medioppia subpectinata]
MDNKLIILKITPFLAYNSFSTGFGLIRNYSQTPDTQIPHMANFDCDLNIGYETKPYIFDFDFPIKGNFTVTWLQMIIKYMIYFSAIPVEIDPKAYLTIDGYNETSDSFLTYIYTNEVQISLDMYPLNAMIHSFAHILVPHNSPSIAIMGDHATIVTRMATSIETRLIDRAVESKSNDSFIDLLFTQLLGKYNDLIVKMRSKRSHDYFGLNPTPLAVQYMCPEI